MSRTTSVTEPQIEAFFAELSRRANVSAACRVSGIGRANAYRLRGNDPTFAERWESAVQEADDVLLDLIIDMASGARSKPVFGGGVQIGETPIYSDEALRTWSRLRFAALRTSESRVVHSIDPTSALTVRAEDLALLSAQEHAELGRLLRLMRSRRNETKALPAPRVDGGELEPVVEAEFVEIEPGRLDI